MDINSRNFLYIPLFLIALVLSGGCSELQVNNTGEAEKDVQVEEIIPSSVGNFIPKELAAYTAKRFANEHAFNYGKFLRNKKVAKNGRDKEVGNILEIKGGSTNTALYFVNFQDGGFVIVSGDKRTSPVLAYSRTNALPASENESVPGGFAVWIQKKVDKVKSHRNLEKENKSSTHFGWEAILGNDAPSHIQSKIEPPDEPPCEETVTEVSPLVQTTWSQGVGYNNFAPHLGCSSPSNGRAWAGCVATAMAQIMRYHEYPQYYDWHLMPNTYGNDYVSGLMLNIGEEVNMDWGCDASGADDDDMAPAFQSFGYSTAHQIGYEETDNYEDVKDELNASHPVLFSGCNEEKFIGISYPDGCHAWVGDGYRTGTYCPSGNTWLQFHMNWGWGGSYDGWYGLDDFSPGDENYDYRSEVVVGIQP